ncbi:unnamed protein product [Pieris brassicae]|uniref:Uncharacterized protein n=1 Tax=Pieris brassicae TaxID=7116 RepID=A0A9P0SST5_PIEBR|nr:unnamed protein product [Pieris brassicae]
MNRPNNEILWRTSSPEVQRRNTPLERGRSQTPQRFRDHTPRRDGTRTPRRSRSKAVWRSCSRTPRRYCNRTPRRNSSRDSSYRRKSNSRDCSRRRSKYRRQGVTPRRRRGRTTPQRSPSLHSGRDTMQREQRTRDSQTQQRVRESYTLQTDNQTLSKPTKLATKFKEFMQTMKHTARVIHYALPKLSGLAQKWYEGLPSLMFSWLEWQDKLSLAFPSEDNYAKLLTEMLACRARFEDRSIRTSAEAAQFSEPDKFLVYLRNVKIVKRTEKNSALKWGASDNKRQRTTNVNGRELDCFVDFGSQCTILTESVAKELAVSWSTQDLPVLRGFGDSLVNSLGRCNIQIEVDSAKADVDALIVPDGLFKVPLLLGQSFTEEKHNLVYKTNDKLKITTTLAKDHIFLCNSELVTINGLSEVKMQASTPNYNGDVFIEQSICHKPQKEYEIVQSAVRITDGYGKIVVRGLNPSGFEIKPEALLVRALPLIKIQFVHVNKINQNVL